MRKNHLTLKYLLYIFAFIFIYTANDLTYSQTKEDCLACHSDNTMTMEKNGKEISLFVDENILNTSTHKKINCISCHKGFNPEEVPHKENIEPVNCLSCHTNALTKHAFHPDILRSKGTGTSQSTSCKGCHGTHDVQSPKSPNAKFSSARLSESCGKCHKSVSESYIHSVHNKALVKGIAGAPTCITCHKNQVTLKQSKSLLEVKRNQAKLCEACHDTKKVATDQAFVHSYVNSVHGKALENGNEKAANCVNCHSNHDIRSPGDPGSPVFKTQVPVTCSKCHTDIYNEYKESIHGTQVAKGNMDAPVCTDCHGEHNILQTNDPNAPVAYKNVAAQVCSPCHSSVTLTKKYGLDPNRFSTYKDSYHGLALEGGSTTVANCASCHGFHNIKASSDPTSTVNKNNLSKTCGRCHPGANKRFTEGTIHVNQRTPEKSEAPILYWISLIYTILIILTIGGMFIHNLLDFIKKSHNKYLRQRGLLPVHKFSRTLYLRMTLQERLQHFALLISFLTLVITGFMLRFPETWWARHIYEISSSAFDYRSLIHRIAAVIMVAASLYHIFYLSFTERGKQLLRDLLPKYKDLQDAIGMFKYNIGLSKEKPLLDRFSYVEKAEYWALIWGTAVMTLTGIALWFENMFISNYGLLTWQVARSIHYFEAWLAFLSIVVWHFYFVMFNPDIFPMNLAWIKGTIPEEEMAEEHPLEFKRIKDKQKDEDEDVII